MLSRSPFSAPWASHAPGAKRARVRRAALAAVLAAIGVLVLAPIASANIEARLEIKGHGTVQELAPNPPGIFSCLGSSTPGATVFCWERSYGTNANMVYHAIPQPGWRFDGWQGEALAPSWAPLTCQGANPTTFFQAMGDCTFSTSAFDDGHRRVFARFTDLRVPLTVVKSGAGSGTVSSSPGGINCGPTCNAVFLPSASVTLIASPAPGSYFAGWSGGGCFGAGGCVVSLSTPTIVNAAFTPNPTLTVSKSGAGSGTVSSGPGGISCGGTCSAAFSPGTSVLLSATPDPGSYFAGWSGGGCAGTGTCQVLLSTATSVGAAFAPNPTLTVSTSGDGSGTVSSVPGGIDCGATCEAAFSPGTAITLTATPAPGSTFVGWTGGGCLGTLPCVVFLGSATTVTAAFTQDPALTVTKAGAGTGTVSSAPGGISCGATCAAVFSPGASITLTATAAPGSSFAGWSGGGGCAGTGTCQVTVVTSLTVTATFIQNPTLTVSKAGGGSGTVTSNPGAIACGATCAAAFSPGTGITLTATAAPGSTFAGWGGGGCAGTGTCQVTLLASTTVTATFAQNPTLTVSKAGSGSGTVTSNPGAIDCGATCAAAFATGTGVTLTATPAPGSTFAGWGGGGCGGTGTCQVTLAADSSVTATFALVEDQRVLPTLTTLTSARFSIVWKAGRAKGTLEIVGTTDGPASLTVTLRRRVAAGSQAVRGWTVDHAVAGQFTSSLKLPAALLPGRYTLDVTGSSPGGIIPPASMALTLTGPPSGILADSWISAFPGKKAPVTRLPGRRTEIWVTFKFSALPTRGAITIAWITPDSPTIPPPAKRVHKPRRTTVISGLRVLGGEALRPGRYTAVLFVGNVELRRISARIG